MCMYLYVCVCMVYICMYKHVCVCMVFCAHFSQVQQSKSLFYDFWQVGGLHVYVCM